MISRMAALRVWRNAGVAQTGGGMIGSPQIKISVIALRRCRNLDTSVNLESARKQTGACLGAAAAAGEVWPGTE